MKRFYWVVGLLALARVVDAGTFTANGGQGTSIVDAAGTGDYTSLAQAAQDFSSYATGCTGNWTLLIRSDLSEPNNVAFGNNTNGFHVTVKPAPATTPVVTFTTTTRPAGTVWDGALCIGTSATLVANNMDYPTTTSNFTVDGSNTTGGTTRDMTLRTTPAMESFSVLCRVVCGCDNVAFKNLNLDNLSSGTQESICVEYTSRRIGGIDYHPSNGTVSNCLLRAQGSLVGEGIQCRTWGGNTAGTAQSGMSFTGNTVEVTNLGMTVAINANTVISHNTFDVFQSWVASPVSNGRPQAVTHVPNSSTGWTFEFTHNKFLRYGNVNWPFVLPQLTVGFSVSPATGTYEINNNFFGGFDYPSTTTIASQQSLRTIQVGAASCTNTFNIYHNSFNNQDITQINGNPATTGYDRLVPLSIPSAGFAGTIRFKDNIVRFEQHNGVVFYLRSPSTGTFDFDYNAYYLGTAGAKMACWNAASPTAAPTHVTLADWKAGGFDAHSVEANPTVAHSPATGKWISNSDLHFDAGPGSLFAGSPVGVVTDIDDQARTVPVLGADELPLDASAAVRDWHLFR